MNNLEWALTCAARGWLVFPSLGKKPLVKWGTESTTDPDLIATYFAAHPERDVCIKTGEASGIVVIDWDAYKQENPTWPLDPQPCGYTARTPKGGYHFYYAHPGYPVANSAGALAPYVDVRGDGGMVVAYQPNWEDSVLAALPEGWGTRRNTVTEQVAPIAEPYAGDGDGLTLAVSLLEGYARLIADAAEGTLNTTLWKCASDAFKMVAAGELSEESVRLLLYTAAVSAGHPQQGAAQTIASARSRGMLEPTSCVDMYWRSKGRT
jgi:hypothetical protein